ncbi:DUF1894 domain-containing protein [Methanoplanus endosymbiosus]|uniref:DUF1894 domain-containing protein n=1 Tax=Methanoplanus endosymbiosus TaxID=33865 RepID=A0A9E7TL94_9EURY|nr:DUF1894 domain-containing protein [Methanoplanus endosymbiosus]UUX93495.1 DUF1894 domain-containing protein [Methanoplanus endosymbiosus]
MNRCANKLSPEIIEDEISPDDAVEYINRRASEVYEMPEGFTIKGITILGEPPLYVGLKLKKKEILFYFKKPCFGTQLMKIKATEDEFDKIRAEGKRTK